MAPNPRLHKASVDHQNKKNRININPRHESLHSVLGIPEGQKIPASRIAQARNSPDPAIRKKAVFAANARKWNR